LGYLVQLESGQPIDAFLSLDAEGARRQDWSTGLARVSAIVGDGEGGWFVGGARRGGTDYRLLHLRLDGSAAVLLEVSQSIDVLAHDPLRNQLYVGGSFSYHGAQSRSKFAVVDLDGGGLTECNPSILAGAVRTIALGADAVYLGGDFTSIGGQIRQRFAALNRSDCSLLPLQLSATAAVHALALDGDLLFVAGAFATLAQQNTPYLAAVDLISGSPTAWRPSPDGTVRALALQEGALYAVGSFTSAGGQARAGAAAFDTATGALLPWNPAANAQIDSVAADAERVVLAGGFTPLGAAPRRYIAAVDGVAGTPLAWNQLGLDAPVRVVAQSGDSIAAGGDFTLVNAVARQNVAAVDPASGGILDWDPDADGAVHTMALYGQSLYLGGDFTSVGGGVFPRLAAVSTATGAALDWNPAPDGRVNALLIDSGTLYVAGAFSSAAGDGRSGGAAFDLADAALTAWNPAADGPLRALAAAAGRIYAGGNYTAIGGQTRSHLAALDPATGLADGFDPSPDGEIYALGAYGGTVYATGLFSAFAGEMRWGLAAFDGLSGALSSWDPWPLWPLYAVLPLDAMVLMGGGADVELQAYNRQTGAPLLSLTADGEIYSLAESGGVIYAGGSFTRIGQLQGRGLVIVAAPLSNEAPPSISGTARDGELLSLDRGSWQGLSTTTYTTTWSACAHDGSQCSVLAGQNADTLLLAPADVGKTFKASVTAADWKSRVTEETLLTAIVAPKATARPELRGGAEEGQMLVSTEGQWNGASALTLKFYWYRCCEGACLLVSSGADPGYLIAAADVGCTLRAQVGAAASGSAETLSDLSEPSSPVTANPAAPSPTPSATPPPFVPDKTRLTEPPVVTVDERTNDVFIDLKEFSGIEFESFARTARERNVFIRYVVVVNRKGGAARSPGRRSAASDSLRRVSRRNQVVVRRMRPGRYGARYRVELVHNDRVVTSTNWSPSARFAVRR